MYYVYILESESTGRYYTGQTDNLEARVERHNKGRNRSTRPYLPWRLKWWMEFETRSEAVKVESRLKALKKRDSIDKFVLINSFGV